MNAVKVQSAPECFEPQLFTQTLRVQRYVPLAVWVVVAVTLFHFP